MTASATGATITAVERGERVLAAAVTLSRAGALAVLGASLASEPWRAPRAIPTAVLAGILVLDSAALISSCRRAGFLARSWAAVDLVCLVVVLSLCAVPAVLPGRPGQSPFYNFTVVAAIAWGLAEWPVAMTLGGATALGLASLAPALRPGSSYPVWNAVPDSATYVGAALVCWVLARLLRASARSLDQHREAALAKSAALARQRELVRQQRDLESHLMSTVGELARTGTLADPGVREQVRVEAAWLSDVVRYGLPEPGADLRAALRVLVAEKTAAGMRIDLELPEIDPSLAPVTAGAVVEAVREALTNVAKHAGPAGVVVAGRPSGDGFAVEVVDTGRGYDPASTPGRVGQARSIRERIRGVGGHVEIESAPGAGTRVRLWVPFTGKGDAP
jgi:signal transduction histidine kinase